MYVIPWFDFLASMPESAVDMLAAAIVNDGASFTEEPEAQKYHSDAMLQRARGMLNAVGMQVETVTIERDGVPFSFVSYRVTTVISPAGVEYVMRLARERLALSRGPVPERPTPKPAT